MLGPNRQIFGKDLTLVANRAGERGGILSRIATSGVEVVGYLEDISNCPQPIGIQLNDIEHVDLGYQYHPWRDRGMRQVAQPGENVGIAMHCIVDTNFIHPDANPHSASKAYLAPSGLITNDASLGGPLLGHFMSELNDSKVAGLPNDSREIIVYGGGFVRGSYQEKVARGNYEIQEPSIEKITLQSPGWCRVRITL